jgi:hypothetical protein
MLTGCATVTGSSMQQITVDARDKNNQPITNVQCKLMNDKGTWFLKAPDTATVQKSATDLHIIAEKEGHEPGTAKVVSKAGAGMFGNIILGGGIGAIIDHTKGTAYSYPTNITIVMGENQTLPTRFKNRNKVSNSTSSLKNS